MIILDIILLLCYIMVPINLYKLTKKNKISENILYLTFDNGGLLWVKMFRQRIY